MKFKEHKPIRKFKTNTKGIDYIVGDIHGCFSALQDKLKSIDFNPKTDRLFSTGDLIDRGPESHLALEWLDKPWFYAVAGNHEQMLLDAIKDDIWDCFIYNGGYWFLEYKGTDVEYKLYDCFQRLPLIIEINTQDGIVAVLHSQLYNDNYKETVKLLSSEHKDKVKQIIQWSRDKMQDDKQSKHIKGVKAVVAGHTPVNDPVVIANYYAIDTGAVFKGGKFSILRVDTLEFV